MSREDLDFHNNRFQNKDIREQLGKKYSCIKHAYEKFESLIWNGSRESRVLELGFGKGQYTLASTQKYRQIFALDLNHTACKKVETEKKINAFVGTANQLPFQTDSIDLVYGLGLLHHCEPRLVLNEVVRVLKSEGRAYFLEPLAGNPVLEFYRKFTPKMRTSDEQPFDESQIQDLLRSYEALRVQRFGLLTLPWALFPGRIPPKTIQAWDTNVCKGSLGRFAWIALLELSGPGLLQTSMQE